MFLSILYGVFFWSIISFTPFLFIPLHLLKLAGRREEAWNYVTRLAKVYTWTIFRATRCRIRVQGWENFPKAHNLCIIANHQAYADILTIMDIIPRMAGYIAKKELDHIPFLRDWMREVGCYFMKRDNMRDGLNAILFGVKRIKAGYPMVIFPEGTRSRGPKLREFRKGSLKLATKAKAVIVPLSIQGSYRLLEETGRVQACTIRVLIHPAIETQALGPAEEDGLPDRLYTLIRGGVEKLQVQEG